jgi:hypothetical protein
MVDLKKGKGFTFLVMAPLTLRKTEAQDARFSVRDLAGVRRAPGGPPLRTSFLRPPSSAR